jgi:hypothetical protein
VCVLELRWKTILLGVARGKLAVYAECVQRLFTMFPVGRAGIALLLLRLAVAGACIANGMAVWPSAISSWFTVVFLLPAFLLIFGFLTPYGAAFCCLIECVSLAKIGLGHSTPIIMTLVNSTVVALGGPGGYSIDARIFGRHLLVIPPRK